MIVVDASAVVAVLGEEHDGETIAQRIRSSVQGDGSGFASTVTVWEASLAVGRIWSIDRKIALREVEAFLRAFRIAAIAPDETITALAVEAAQRYGLGAGYPGILNLGDCFSYATAKHLNARLLFKGDDFTRTDITPA